MIHSECGTYGAYERCLDCGLAWCPRCRTWFRPAGKAARAHLSEDGKRDA